MSFNFHNNPKTVLLRAPLLTQSGYGVHSRQIMRWLLKKEQAGKIKLFCQALPWGNTPWYINNDLLDGLVGQIMTRIIEPQEKHDVTIQLQLPNEWDSKLGDYNVGVSAVVETDRCNPQWISSCNQMDCVIVPSNHAAKALTNSGTVHKQIQIIPESFSSACLLANDKLPTMPKFSTNFNFLVFGQITGNNPYNDRKNTFFTLKWLFETFKDDPDVGIVLKTNAGRNTKIDRAHVKKMVEQIINEIRGPKGPKVHLLHGEMSDEEVVSLYKHPQIKGLVALTLGEGFGLPILEAAACGLPIIATNWSGHLDFLSHGKFISVQYILNEVHKSRIDNQIFMNGSRWAMPIEQDAKKKLLKFKESSMIPQEWARELSHKIQQLYCEEAIFQKYDDVIKGI